MGYYKYNGVTLPEIPAEVIEGYPYFAILDETTYNARYALIAATVPLYVKDDVYITSDDGIAIYRTPMDNPASWVYGETGKVHAELENVDGVIKAPLWTNADILSGSSDSTTVLYDADDLPVHAEEVFKISRSALENLAAAARQASGSNWLLSIQDICSILTNSELVSLPSKIAYYNDFNGHEYNRIGAYGYGLDASGNAIITNAAVQQGAWGDRSAMVANPDNGAGAKAIFFHNVVSNDEKFIIDNGFDGTKSWSFGAWFKLYEIPNSYARLLNTYVSGLVMYPGNTQIYFEENGTANEDFGEFLEPTWLHLCVVCVADGTSNVFKLYRNGELRGTLSKSNLTMKHISLGTSDSYVFKGLYSNVFFADDALTDDEVRAMMLRP